MMKLLLTLLLLPLFAFSQEITKLMFRTYEVKGKEFKEVVESLKEKLNEKGLKVRRTLTISEAVRARGAEDFPNYTVLLACDVEGKEKLLEKTPFMSNLIPCSVAVYQTEKGVSITIINHEPYLIKYSQELSKEDKNLVSKTYRELNSVLATFGKPEKVRISQAQRQKFIREFSKVSFETSDTIKGMSFDDVKTLLKSSLDGVNMNILGVEDITPNYSFMLACNLTYGEKILKEFPQFGTLAPCRVYVYQKPDNSVGVGYINIQTLVRLYKNHLHKDAVEIFEKADQDIKSAIREVKGE